ncbi:MAG: protein kinase, partial [Chlamydiota bacterium]
QGVTVFANEHFRKRAKLESLSHDNNNTNIMGDKEQSLRETIETDALEKLLFSKPGEAVSFETEGLPFIAKSNGSNIFDSDPQIFLWQGKVVEKESPDFLGNGSFGVAQKVYDLTNETFKAIKIANSVLFPDQAAQELKREYETMNSINGENIQKTPELYINDLLPDKPGMIQDLYSGDLSQFDYQKLTTKQQLPLLVQVFGGVSRFHQSHIHGDIKAKNIFVLDPQDEYSSHKAFIADLGGARKISDFDENFFANKFHLGTTFTPGYYTNDDHTKLGEAFRSKNRNEWIHLQKKRDIFAGVLTACHLLTGIEYWYCSEETFPKTIKDIEQSLKPLINQTTINILVRALNEDPLKRPEISEIIDALQKEENAPPMDDLKDLFKPTSYETPEFSRPFITGEADVESSLPLQLIFPSENQLNLSFLFSLTNEKTPSEFPDFPISNLELNSNLLV